MIDNGTIDANSIGFNPATSIFSENLGNTLYLIAKFCNCMIVVTNINDSDAY